VKELTGTGTGTTDALPDQALALLAAVQRYPEWHPDVVKRVEVVQHDDSGQPTRVQTKLRVERGPMTREFDLLMDVRVERAGSVKLTRVPNEPGDDERFEVTWHVEGSGPTRIRVDLLADLDVPRFLPLGGVGDAIAQQFVNAATTALQP
jgi:hypothetical protein